MAPSVTAVVCPKQILQQSVPEAEPCWCYGSAARLHAGTSHGLFYLSFPLIRFLIKHFSTLFIFLVVPVKVCIRWRQLFPHHPQSRGKRIRKEWGSVQSTRMLHCHLHGSLQWLGYTWKQMWQQQSDPAPGQWAALLRQEKAPLVHYGRCYREREQGGHSDTAVPCRSDVFSYPFS